jgi:hypothetical protein
VCTAQSAARSVRNGAASLSPVARFGSSVPATCPGQRVQRATRFGKASWPGWPVAALEPEYQHTGQRAAHTRSTMAVQRPSLISGSSAHPPCCPRLCTAASTPFVSSFHRSLPLFRAVQKRWDGREEYVHAHIWRLILRGRSICCRPSHQRSSQPSPACTDPGSNHEYHQPAAVDRSQEIQASRVLSNAPRAMGRVGLAKLASGSNRDREQKVAGVWLTCVSSVWHKTVKDHPPQPAQRGPIAAPSCSLVRWACSPPYPAAHPRSQLQILNQTTWLLEFRWGSRRALVGRSSTWRPSLVSSAFSHNLCPSAAWPVHSLDEASVWITAPTAPCKAEPSRPRIGDHCRISQPAKGGVGFCDPMG